MLHALPMLLQWLQTVWHFVGVRTERFMAVASIMKTNEAKEIIEVSSMYVLWHKQEKVFLCTAVWKYD